jgi:hypothetical protein
LVFIDGGLLGRGIRVLGGVVHQTARGEAVLGPDSSKTTSDRRAPPVSVLRRPAAYRFGRAGLSRPGPFLGLGQLVSPQPFSIFYLEKDFFSNFETDLFYFCNKTCTI